MNGLFLAIGLKKKVLWPPLKYLYRNLYLSMSCKIKKTYSFFCLAMLRIRKIKKNNVNLIEDTLVNLKPAYKFMLELELEATKKPTFGGLNYS